MEPHPPDVRLYCTMIRHRSSSEPASESSSDVGATYTLYLEHLGGFLPLLKGKKVSKLRPEFVIYDPSLTSEASDHWLHLPPAHHGRHGVLPLDTAASSEDSAASDSESRRGDSEDLIVYRAAQGGGGGSGPGAGAQEARARRNHRRRNAANERR